MTQSTDMSSTRRSCPAGTTKPLRISTLASPWSASARTVGESGVHAAVRPTKTATRSAPLTLRSGNLRGIACRPHRPFNAASMQDGRRAEAGHHEFEFLVIRNLGAARREQHPVRGLIQAEEKSARRLDRVLAIALVGDAELLPAQNLRGIGVKDVGEPVNASSGKPGVAVLIDLHLSPE